MGQKEARRMRKAVFFDLDGTLLPLDMDTFMRGYMKAIVENGFYSRISERKGEEIFGRAVVAMALNDGRALNRDVFFDVIAKESGADRDMLIAHMDAFYTGEFLQLKAATRADKHVKQTIEVLREKGYRLILATNPMFPPVATDTRVRWAGLDPGDFEYITYYDNSRYCKPNPKYFEEILDHIGLSAAECYIVGNDVRDDLSAVALGFEAFLVLDHVIGDVEKGPKCQKGSYSDLLRFAENLPRII
jgi:HAD superfamily hydrolase (TIGR01549 family)